MSSGSGSVNYGKIFTKLWYGPWIIVTFYLIMSTRWEFLGSIPIMASLKIRSGFFSKIVRNEYSFSPPGYPVWCLYTFCYLFLPVIYGSPMFTTIHLSPALKLRGEYVTLCFPRINLEIISEIRPIGIRFALKRW